MCMQLCCMKVFSNVKKRKIQEETKSNYDLYTYQLMPYEQNYSDDRLTLVTAYTNSHVLLFKYLVCVCVCAYTYTASHPIS